MKNSLLLTFLVVFSLGVFGQTQTQFARLMASNVTLNSEYGRGVCVNGDYAIVGALQDDHSGLTDAGGAFVYHYENGAWTFKAKLISGDPDAVDHFGRSVYINDKYAIVGCSYSDDPDTYNGSAYIYVNNNGVWTQQAKLLASDRRKMDRFGVAVGIYGDYAMVSAYGADYTVNGTTYSNGGAVYVYHLSGTTWTEVQRLIPNDPLTEMKFGWGLSIYEGNVLIGTSEDRYNNTDGVVGSAYMFSLENGTWNQTAKLVPADAIDGDNFGAAVSLHKDYAVVGAFEDDDKGTNSGSSYIYHYENGAWTMQQKLVGSNSASADNFGFSVGIYENMAIIGAYHSNKGYNDTGSAFLFTRTGTTWTQTTELVASDPAISDQLGWFVSISNGWALAGNPRWDLDHTSPAVDKATNEGCALMWQIPTVATTNTPVLSSLSPVNGATGVAVDQSLSVVFDRNIQFATASSQIVIKRTADGSVFQSFAVGTGVTDAKLTISGSTLNIAHNNFENGVDYYIQLTGSPITSTTGDAFTGLALTTNWVFKTAYVAASWAASSPALSGQTKSTITFTGNVNQGGTYYYIISANATAPSLAQLAAAQDGSGNAALISGSGTSTADVAFSTELNISSLTSQTQYYVYAAVKNAGDLYTSVAQLTFNMLDVAAPVYQNATPSVSNISGNGAGLNIQINEAGTAHYVVLPLSASVPSVTNVINGQDASGLAVTHSGVITLSAATLSQTAISGLSYQTGYSVYVVTTDNNSNSTETLTATRVNFMTLTASLTAPAITFSPANAAINVPLNQVITVAFDKAIYRTSDATAVTSGNVAALLTLTEIEPVKVDASQINPPLPPEVKVAFTATYNTTTNTITITPSSAIKANCSYVISLASVQDDLGNVASAATSTFTVGDVVAPVTAFYAPLSGASNVSVSAPLVVTFNEAIRTTAGTGFDAAALQTLIDLRVDGGASEVAFTASVDADNKVITITPAIALTAATSYALTVNRVEDLLGNEQSMASGILFSTDTYNVWTGAGNTSVFADNANWAASYVANASAIIPQGTATALIASDTKLNNLIIDALGSVTVQSGATLTIANQLLIGSTSNGNGSLINNGTIKVDAAKVSVKQAISNSSAWYYLSSPVAAFNFASDAQAKSFINAQGQYVDLSSTADAMNGYLVKSLSDIIFKGALNDGDQSIAVNRSTNGNGWNLVGNPYSSAIDWDLIATGDKDNIQNAFWIWLNSNQYGTYNGDAGIGTNLDADNSQIPSNHAFWVNANSAGSLSLTNASRIHNTQSYLKKSSVSTYPMVKLTGVSGTVKDETVIAAIPQATASVEKFDSEKLFGANNNALELYTEVDGKQLTINSLSTFGQETVIPLGYKVQSAGNYQIVLSQAVSATDNQSVVLEDKLLNITKSLTVGDAYQFTSDVANTTSRFALHISSSQIVDSEKSVNVYSQQHVVFIALGGISNAQFEVMDMTGRIIAAGNATSDVISNVTVKNTGIYMVSITVNGKSVIKKVIVK